MSDSTQQTNPLLTSPVVYSKPYAGEIRADVGYADRPELVMDIYYPEVRSKLSPAVLLVTGLPDAGYEARMDMKLKEVKWYVSWAELLAASGMVAITYSNREPYADTAALIEFLRKEGTELGIDCDRLGVISQSANVANAVAILSAATSLRCAALFYGYVPDIGNSTLVADALASYGIAPPKALGDDFPVATPMLIVRAGQEEHLNLNAALDLFASEALRRNAPLSLVNYPKGVHCFDILDSSPESVRIVRQVLDYLQLHLASDPTQDCSEP